MSDPGSFLPERFLGGRIKMEKKHFITIFFLFLCFFGSRDLLKGQSKPDNCELLKSEKLNKRLKMFVSFQTIMNYAELYEMLANDQKKGSGSREFFIKTYETSDNKAERLTNFYVEKVGLFEPANDFALIIGCGEYTKNKQKKYYESQVEVVYENDDWYFRSLIGASVGFGTKLKKCGMPKSKVKES